MKNYFKSLTKSYKLNSIFNKIFFLFILNVISSCRDNKNIEVLSLPKSIVSLNEQITKSPKEADLYYKRGMEYYKLKKDSIALIDFKRACLLDTTKANYYSAVGDILFEHKDISGSVVYIQKALSINPNDTKALLKISKMYLFLKEYPKVFIGLNNVLRADVYNDEAYFLKGMAYKDLKDTMNALSSFSTASKINPDKPEYYMQLALLNVNIDIEKAKLYFENAYKADTNNIEPINSIGFMYQDKKQYKLAKETFRKCIHLDADFARAYYNLGVLLMDEDSIDLAIKQFSFATKFNPTYTDAYLNRGICYETKRDTTAAATDYNQALQFDPAYELALQGLKRINK
jgi:tetratricopeptide (TPR) repeat protein